MDRWSNRQEALGRRQSVLKARLDLLRLHHDTLNLARNAKCPQSVPKLTGALELVRKDLVEMDEQRKNWIDEQEKVKRAVRGLVRNNGRESQDTDKFILDNPEETTFENRCSAHQLSILRQKILLGVMAILVIFLFLIRCL